MVGAVEIEIGFQWTTTARLSKRCPLEQVLGGPYVFVYIGLVTMHFFSSHIDSQMLLF